MPSIQQKTLKSVVRSAGVGLHSGKKIDFALHPAPVNSGIVFCRTDLMPNKLISAHASLVGETRLNSGLVKGDVKINTVEHLLSAFAGLEVDNCLVEISGSEVPVMDGSANTFVFLMQSVGLEEQDALRQYIEIKSPVMVSEDERWARLEPGNKNFTLDFHIDFDHPLVKSTGQSVSVKLSPENYLNDIGRARTFGFMKEFEALRSVNLGLGASLDNAVAVDEFRVLNADGLRYGDELARHKLLDALGDLYLLGYPILGHYSAFKSGHALNNKLARMLLTETSTWNLVTLKRQEPKKVKNRIQTGLRGFKLIKKALQAA